MSNITIKQAQENDIHVLDNDEAEVHIHFDAPPQTAADVVETAGLGG